MQLEPSACSPCSDKTLSTSSSRQHFDFGWCDVGSSCASSVVFNLDDRINLPVNRKTKNMHWTKLSIFGVLQELIKAILTFCMMCASNINAIAYRLQFTQRRYVAALIAWKMEMKIGRINYVRV